MEVTGYQLFVGYTSILHICSFPRHLLIREHTRSWDWYCGGSSVATCAVLKFMVRNHLKCFHWFRTCEYRRRPMAAYYCEYLAQKCREEPPQCIAHGIRADAFSAGQGSTGEGQTVSQKKSGITWQPPVWDAGKACDKESKKLNGRSAGLSEDDVSGAGISAVGGARSILLKGGMRSSFFCIFGVSGDVIVLRSGYGYIA